ncbi:MAG: substrate-binding domain-containing protein [Planctomycetales bacterium]|nr:substrate-binding domain-containing protein [Planctomycetales bacterium]
MALAALAVALSGAGGCGNNAVPDGTAAGTSPHVFRIAVIPKGTSHDFWASVHAGAEKAAAEFDDVEITWKGPLTEGDTAKQIETVEGFIADGYDGICLAPCDAVALRRPVDQAIQNGVPVVIFDSGLKDMDGIVSYVATNNERGGRVAGEYLAELLGGSGNVVLMRYDLNSESTDLREKGFLGALEPFEGITLISADKYAGPTESDAIELGENLLANFGGDVNGIFCPNQSTASGMLTVLRRDQRGLAGKVKFVGFDSGENIVSGLEKGDLNATVLQDPVTMGYQAVEAMRQHLLGDAVPARVETQEVLATGGNLDDPTVHKLLYPEAAE